MQEISDLRSLRPPLQPIFARSSIASPTVIFNGTSAFGAVGTSIVNDVDVSGISLDKSQNQLSVTLTKTARQDASHKTITSNQSIRMPGTTERMTTATAAGDSSSVSII